MHPLSYGSNFYYHSMFLKVCCGKKVLALGPTGRIAIAIIVGKGSCSTTFYKISLPTRRNSELAFLLPYYPSMPMFLKVSGLWQRR